MYARLYVHFSKNVYVVSLFIVGVKFSPCSCLGPNTSLWKPSFAVIHLSLDAVNFSPVAFFSNVPVGGSFS